MDDLTINQPIWNYIREVTVREPDVLRRLREETARHPQSMMQISPEQGQFMGMLMHLMGARKTLEVGVFTGYSSLSVALALPPDGRIAACDVSEEYTSIARRYWRDAGVDSKIDLRLAPAVQTLDALLAAGETGSFDFAFIDADKSNYTNYYERALQLIRPGGLIAVDNVLWSGKVIDPTETDADTQALRAFNSRLKDDQRIHLTMLAMRDGLTLACKK